jgi:voltage-gated potassium channel
MRTLRLLKLYRYSRGLQLLARGFNQALDQLKALGFAVFVTAFASQGAMYEAERYAQPETFGSLIDSFWFTVVTVTTVGYGDMYPITLAGRIVAILTFITGITLVATFTGVMGSSFAVVFQEEAERKKSGKALKEK